MTNGVWHLAGRGEVNSNHVWTDAVDSQLCIWTGFSDQSDVLNIQKLPQKQCFLACREYFLPVGRLQVERCLPVVINLKWPSKNTDNTLLLKWQEYPEVLPTNVPENEKREVSKIANIYSLEWFKHAVMQLGFSGLFLLVYLVKMPKRCILGNFYKF